MTVFFFAPSFPFLRSKKFNIFWRQAQFLNKIPPDSGKQHSLTFISLLTVICNVRGITKLITHLIHRSLYRRLLRCLCGQLGYIRQKQPVIWWRTLQNPIQIHLELFRQYTGLFGRRLLVVTPPVFPEHLKPEARRFDTRTSLPLRSMFPSSRTSRQISTVLRPNKENLGIRKQVHGEKEAFRMGSSSCPNMRITTVSGAN